MPATQIPASDRQISFINSLRTERGLPTITADSGYTGGRNGTASQEITRLLAIPRPAQQTAQGSGVDMEAPSAETRAGRMLRAGGIEATVTFADGRHVTLRVSTRVRTGRGWRNGEPGEQGARTNIKVAASGERIGWINVVDGRWALTLRTRRDDYRMAVHALFEYAATGTTAGPERVQEASRCGRCHRALTDPVSIDRGVGPECYGRSTGSQHVSTAASASGASAEEIRSADRQRGSDEHVCGCPNGNAEGITERECIAAGIHRPAMTATASIAQRDAELHEAQDAEQRYNRDFAARERAQEEAAFASDPDYRRSLDAVADAAPRAAQSLTEMAADFGQVQVITRVRQENVRLETEQARDLIQAALKAYVEDELTDQAAADRALATFDRLAR